ncbi:MAG: urease accessory protein UreE [Burkholderiales bacterium]
MITITHILGNASEHAISHALHRIEHDGGLETISLDQQDMLRHRLRVSTDMGNEVAIALSRNAHLEDGSVLLLEDSRAIIVRMTQAQWMVFEARDTAAGLELGYFAGNMHWKVRFDGARLQIAVTGDPAGYLERLAKLVAERKIVHVA